MPQRPCIRCKRLTRNGTRCEACAAVWSATRGSSTARGYGSRWRAIRQAVLDRHIALYGPVCPGYGRPSHESDDLTVDHVVPKARGGGDHPSNLAVLCRGCNSSKGSA